MPRTKIPKNSKRNREAANREEKIRIFEMRTDAFQFALDDIEVKYKSMIDNALIKTLQQTTLGAMKMGEFWEVLSGFERFEDYKLSDKTLNIASQSICSNATNNGDSQSAIAVRNSRNDEGYLTEDSTIGNAIRSSSNSGSTLPAYNSSMLRSARAMRTPGPLHSARARRERRSRSACGSKLGLPAPGSAVASSSTSNSHRTSRSKMRTPMRPKAFSADRTSRKTRPSSPGTPPMSFLRWPKPGEVALSKFGSPIVVQVMQDKFANVNIPMGDGIFSLRPKKLAEVQPEMLENLDPDTLKQIKTLHQNLQLIVDTASKAGLK